MPEFKDPWLRAVIVFGLAHLIFLAVGLSPGDSITKCFIAPLLAGWAWTNGASNYLVDALILCFFGDLFLELQGTFMLGMISFALAHLAFIEAFRRCGAVERLRWQPINAGAYVIGAFILLIVTFGDFSFGMWLAMAIYTVFLVAMASVAAMVNRVAMIGGAAFVVSDAIIALSEAGRLESEQTLTDIVIMAVYITAITLLTIGTQRADHGHRLDARH